MPEVTRQSIFKQAAAKLRQDFSELSSVPHNALKGSEAENLVRRFLSDHIQKRFDIGSGFIIDSGDRVSRQNDVIIYDALNCPVYRASEDAGIFPSDNVATVIEVKSKLTKRELRDAFEKIADAKSMKKTASPETPGIPLRKNTMGCIFAFESEITLETAAAEYRILLEEFGLGHHPDLVIVLDRGVMSLTCKVRGVAGWSPLLFFDGFGGEQGEGSHLGVAIYPIGEESLDYFLRLVIEGLILFRQVVGSPFPDWTQSSTQGQMGMLYIGPITHEKNPEAARAKRKRYVEELKRESPETRSWEIEVD